MHEALRFDMHRIGKSWRRTKKSVNDLFSYNHKGKGMDAYSIVKLMETKKLGTTCNHAPNRSSSLLVLLTRIDILLVAYDSTRTCYFASVMHRNLSRRQVDV